MSAFDDEFGLFNEEDAEETERRPTLGARQIASPESHMEDVEPEDDTPRRRSSGGSAGRGGSRRTYGNKNERFSKNRAPADPTASRERAAKLLDFLAKKLVDKPEAVIVDNYPPENGEQAAIELIVDPEDIGKVIGRSGRVAQALRTIIRATAEGKVAVEIFDTSELNDEAEDAEDTEDAD